jgi:hypothetical protein
MSDKITQKAETIVNNFEEDDVDVDTSVDEIASMIEGVQDRFTLDLNPAAKTVVNTKLSVSVDASDVIYEREESKQVTVADLEAVHNDAGTNDDGEDQGAWVDIEAEVMGTWEPESSMVAQKATIADHTGRTEVSVFRDDVLELEQGQTVKLENVVTEEYAGDNSVKVVSNSNIIETSADIDAVDNIVSLEGRVVNNITSGQGLIRRCAVEEDGEACGRSVENGDINGCEEHGEDPETYDSLRMLLTVDDGEEAKNVFLHTEEIEAIFDTTLEEQVDEITVDSELPAQLGDDLIGNQIAVEGVDYGDIHANDVVVADMCPDAEDIDESLIRARSISPEM